MDVLLLHLPPARRSYIGSFSLPEPLAHLTLGPALAPRHRVRFVDLRLTPRLERELGSFRPDVAAVGIHPPSWTSADHVLTSLRRRFPGIRILLFPEAEYGNAHVLERPEEFRHPLADALVSNYFLAVLRASVPAVVQAWESGLPLAQVPGIHWKREDGSWSLTDQVPNRVGDIGVPDRTLLGRCRGRYRFGGIGRMAHLFYTFGCRFKCRFCPMSKHDGSIVARSLGDVVRELRAMSEPNVFLQDFEPFLAPGAMDELAREVERAGISKRWYMMTRADTALAEEARIARWKDLGLRWLYLGLDGSTDEHLRELRKGLSIEECERALRRMQALGLGVSVGFVVRSDSTREGFAQLRDHVRRLRPPMVSFTVETPLVGTRLFDDSEPRLTTRDWSLYDLEHAVLPTALPLDEFYREMARLMMLGGRMSWPAMLRHIPPGDLARLFTRGLGAVSALRRQACDHGVPPRAERPARQPVSSAVGARS